jgi:UDP-N-acetylmuramoylalanine--D-glutamate ligase
MDYKGIKALVMGLGLHGGGLQSALFLLRRGAQVTVTDLRDEKTLMPSINELETACKKFKCSPVRYVLGKHEIEDFKNTDIVIKNPGVKPDSPFLLASKKIETDLSLFLTESKARLFAVTGTKGKSGTSSALHWILSKDRKAGKAYLGGNITVSPLTFLEELTDNDDVVLELSSFQLGDIKNYVNADGQPLLKPKAAILTSIMHDHLDRYTSMEAYIDDKRNIYRGQDSGCVTVAGDDDWGKSFRAETKARTLIWSLKQDLSSVLSEGQSGGCIDSSGRGIARLSNWEGVSDEITELVPQQVLTPGSHQKINMLSAALAVFSLGGKAQAIRAALSTFPGIEHRLEFFHETARVRYYNDSAATIPEAAAACIEALTDPSVTKGGLVLVTGGTDKNLDFSPLARVAKKAKSIILLEGTGSAKLIPLLRENGISYKGPFDDLDKAVRCAIDNASGADIVALSPGCASFGMFLNEFDRGRKWKESVLRMVK